MIPELIEIIGLGKDAVVVMTTISTKPSEIRTLGVTFSCSYIFGLDLERVFRGLRLKIFLIFFVGHVKK